LALGDQHLGARPLAEAVAENVGLRDLDARERLALEDRELAHHGDDLGSVVAACVAEVKR
jgi:hypothetical protein